MIRHIAAFDEARGFAKFSYTGILRTPWDLPGDMNYYRSHTGGMPQLMGRMTFEAIRVPAASYQYVLSRDPGLCVPNGEVVTSIEEALRKNDGHDLWVIGGERVYADTLDVADELYITQVEGIYECDRFYPPIPSTFARVSVSGPQQENGGTYWFEVYKRQK